ncbi:hypothetical protein NO263_07505 [Gluconacetobacter entanii]|uniref:Uncharacterized protein n=1 Tax=Gluconacetobacter entanii TaxID=108528 RepID=A0ABT3K5S3_9PROT|nr:hypothetical protein [Gluconacetobacter entanii]MCW4590422.1 hypothetical protein [Gluconacetobacter entanii]MCW4594346.1 hypothetical protein [Gluconacetobacter entanii]NPC88171.1 hypothetical protein [Gluconacetobacter entanii]
MNQVSDLRSTQEAREREAKDPQSFYREVNLSGPPPERPEDNVNDPGLEDLMNRATSSEEG